VREVRRFWQHCGGGEEDAVKIPTPEAKVKSEVLEFLKRSSLIWFRMQSGKVAVKRGFLHLAPLGTADFLIFKGSEPFWIELKAPGQKTQKERAQRQREFAEKVLALGHKHLTAETLDEVIEFVK
jgi:hypothetical protein